MWSLNTNKKHIKYRLNNSSKNMCNFSYYVNVGLCIGTDEKNRCVQTDKKIDASELMLTWWSMEKWNVTLILTTLIIPTKHSYGKDHMYLWRTFEKKKKNMEHHIVLSMAKVVFYWWGLYILLWGQVFLHVPFHWGFHIILFAFQELTHMHVLCTQFRSIVYAPMLHLRSPYQIHIWIHQTHLINPCL
jgi:hypothetical protein